MNAISVRKVEACELTTTMIFILKGLYRTELSEFIVMSDIRQNILYVNSKIPARDVKRFLQIAGYQGECINDPDSDVYEVSNYILHKYGYSTLKILQDFYNDKRRKRESEKAQGQVAGLYQAIRNYELDDDIPDAFHGREFLIYHLMSLAREQKKKTVEHMVGYDIKTVFLYGYFLGLGVITENNESCEDEKKTEYLMQIHRLSSKMNAEQLKKLYYHTNRIFVSVQEKC